MQVESPDILVAGCGTGQQSIHAGSRFKNCKVIDVDLSMSSLAYAKRKTEDLQLSNIEYIQADILDLGKLEKKFHIIECVGVLHHMEDPSTGLKILSSILKSSGLIRLGLYSSLARREIIKTREIIANRNIPATVSGMRSLRKELIKTYQNYILLSL